MNYFQITPPTDDVEILTEADILPDHYDEDEAGEDPFWHRPRHFLQDKDIVQSYLHAAEHRWCTPELAVRDLIDFGLFPHELMLDMYAVFLRAMETGEAV